MSVVVTRSPRTRPSPQPTAQGRQLSARLLFAYTAQAPDLEGLRGGFPQVATGYTATANKDGTGRAWDGARGRYAASVGTLAAPGSGQPITLIARVKPTAADTSQDSIIQIGRYNNPRQQLVIHANIFSGGDVYVAANSCDVYCGGGVLSAGAYSDIAVRYLGGTVGTSTMQIQVDGVWRGTSFAGAAPGALDIEGGNPVRFAHDYNAGVLREYRGVIDYVFGFAGALSDPEIAALRANPWQLFAPIERRIWVPGAGGGGVPTLSSATYVPGSLTSTGFRPRVTAS